MFGSAHASSWSTCRRSLSSYVPFDFKISDRPPGYKNIIRGSEKSRQKSAKKQAYFKKNHDMAKHGIKIQCIFIVTQ